MIEEEHVNKGSLWMLLLLVFVLGFVASLLSLGIWSMGGLSLESIQGDDNLSYNQRMIMRIGLIINHAGMFLLPGLVFCFIYYRDHIAQQLQLKTKGKLEEYLWWGLAIFCSYPFIAGMTKFNMSLPLPEWMKSAQDDTFVLLGNTLTMENPIEFLMNIVLVGVFAAVGEELIFRGILQRYFQRLWNHNPHIGVIAASVLFGGIHMQAERFLPLMILGLILGYAYHYSRSLWVPIILHFVNNSIQVVLLYASTEAEVPEIDGVPDIPIVLVIVSFLLTLGIAYKASLLSPILDEPRS